MIYSTGHSHAVTNFSQVWINSNPVKAIPVGRNLTVLADPGDPSGEVGDDPGWVPNENPKSATPSALHPGRVQLSLLPPGKARDSPSRCSPGTALRRGCCGRALILLGKPSPQIPHTSRTLLLKWFQGRHVRFRVASAPPLICSCSLSSFFPILNVGPSSRFPCSLLAPRSSWVKPPTSRRTQKLLNKISM